MPRREKVRPSASRAKQASSHSRPEPELHGEHHGADSASPRDQASATPSATRRTKSKRGKKALRKEHKKAMAARTERRLRHDQERHMLIPEDAWSNGDDGRWKEFTRQELVGHAGFRYTKTPVDIFIDECVHRGRISPGPLHTAAMTGDNLKVLAAIQSGVDLNLRCACKYGDGAPHHAASAWRSATTDGVTALHHAAENGHVSTVRLLLQAGADVHTCSHDGISCAEAAGTNAHTKCESILEKAMGYDWTDDESQSDDDESSEDDETMFGCVRPADVKRALEIRARGAGSNDATFTDRESDLDCRVESDSSYWYRTWRGDEVSELSDAQKLELQQCMPSATRAQFATHLRRLRSQEM